MDVVKMLKNEPETLRSSLILIVIFTLSSFIPSGQEGPAIDLGNRIFSIVYLIIFIIFSIYCLFRMRGSEKTSNKPPYAKKSIGTWGYSWRAIIVYMLSGLSAFILISTIGGGIERASLIWNAILFFITAPIVAIMCWALYSKNRKGQFNWAISIFRGY